MKERNILLLVDDMEINRIILREALIATGVVLFVFILLINLSVSMLNRRVHYGD